jgi:hypothetical protein
MSTDPDVQDGAVPPDAAADAEGDAGGEASASPEQIYEQAMAGLAVITEEWQKARGPARWIAGELVDNDPTVCCPDCTDGSVGPAVGPAR